MFKTLKKAQKGFTIIELLIVIAIIAILALLVINNIVGANAKARDSQRITDVKSIATKLEEFYNDNGSYPSTFDNTTLAGLDEQALLDPNGGNSITINAGVATATLADGVAAPTSDPSNGASYIYIPFNCNGTACTGFRLKTFIEKPNTTIQNPHVIKSLNN